MWIAPGFADTSELYKRLKLVLMSGKRYSKEFNQEAGKFTSSLIAGKDVKVEVYDTDRYGRTVGIVFTDGIDVNEEIFAAGYAWQ